MKYLPFILTPACKDYIWGGSRLNDDFQKGIDIVPFAESWECSTHPDGQSIISTGPYAGMSLNKALLVYPEWLGTHPLLTTNGMAILPILIKLIDAKENLSIQVHPDDEYALKKERSLGKTEVWYVLATKKNAKIVHGFNQGMDKEQVRRAIETGTIENYLNHVSVQKNELFYIEPGTVHAIGAGCLIAEIQESSNITYRLYDYNRVGREGHQRPLHIDKALEVANLKPSGSLRQPMRVLRYRNGCASELLAQCKYFRVERLLLNTEVQRELVEFKTGSNSFHSLLCIDGCGVLFGENFMLNFFKGDCVFVPADSIPLKIHGKAQLLDVSC